MHKDGDDLIEQIHREFIERHPVPPPLPTERPTIHYTELRDASPDSPLSQEWNVYRREVGRLLAEGLGGKWLLIKGEEILGIWDTEAEAEKVRLQRFRMLPVLQKQILEREPVIRSTRLLHPGFLNPWRG
jgi:hypothetical protein